ncbi:MAG TPA: hypothetical protein VE988_20995 [Gemmataceae bacterium]|nr:hypothetical protein [Gemmataceae bacterium]
MKLPNGDQATIDPRKVTDYCLDPDHDDGKHKARLFQELLGITLENFQLLLDALKDAAANHDAAVGKLDKYGQRYVIDFELAGPAGSAGLRSAWIIHTGEAVPRLVTCYIL